MSDRNDGESYRPLKTPTTDIDKYADKYVYGLKRWLVTVAVTLVTFLTLLDTTIIVTVGLYFTSNFALHIL